jgi:hypothetical protein
MTVNKTDSLGNLAYENNERVDWKNGYPFPVGIFQEFFQNPDSVEPFDEYPLIRT